MQLVCKNTGEVVTRRGDPGNCAYIVLTGAVEVRNRLIVYVLVINLLILIIYIYIYIYIYIVQKTEPQPTTYGSTSGNTAATAAAAAAVSPRILRWATLIGASALTHGDPYYDNTTAIGKSHSYKYYINYIYSIVVNTVIATLCT